MTGKVDDAGLFVLSTPIRSRVKPGKRLGRLPRRGRGLKIDVSLILSVTGSQDARAYDMGIDNVARYLVGPWQISGKVEATISIYQLGFIH